MYITLIEFVSDPDQSDTIPRELSNMPTVYTDQRSPHIRLCVYNVRDIAKDV